VLEDIVDLIDTGLVDAETALLGVSESDVEDSSVLGGVDVVTGEHRVSELLDLGFSGKVEKGREDLLIDQVLGVIEEKRDIGGRSSKVLGEGRESRRVGSKQILEDKLGLLGRVKLLELFPSSVFYFPSALEG
jgi:hypothetical protein